MTKLSIKNWINYNPNVGVEGLHLFGYPGTGKTNFATGLIQKCLQKGELLVMPGDRLCEWRHYPYHPKFPSELVILIPDSVEIFYYPDKETVQSKGIWKKVNYTNINIFDYLDLDHQALIIYDQHLRLSSRACLWVNILEQLLNRNKYVDRAIALLFNEAGILFPQHAQGEHWKAVNKFSEYFVETRKALVRTVLVSQIETEIESTLRKKCLYNIIRKSYLGKNWPPLVRKVSPFTALNEYQIVLGRGLYLLDNIAKKYFEFKKIFKMIPAQLIDLELAEPNGKGDKSSNLTFQKKVRSVSRVSLGKEFEELGIEEGDMIELTISKVKELA